MDGPDIEREASSRRALADRVEALERRVAELEAAAGRSTRPAPVAEAEGSAVVRPRAPTEPRGARAFSGETRQEGQSLRRLGVSRRRPPGAVGRALRLVAIVVIGLAAAVGTTAGVINLSRFASGGWNANDPSRDGGDSIITGPSPSFVMTPEGPVFNPAAGTGPGGAGSGGSGGGAPVGAAPAGDGG